jgi:hypothetical protein
VLVELNFFAAGKAKMEEERGRKWEEGQDRGATHRSLNGRRKRREVSGPLPHWLEGSDDDE